MAAGDVITSIPNPITYPCNVFDGVDDYVEIPHNANQLGANLSNGFTISAWINPRSSGEATSGNIIDKSTATNGANGFIFVLGTVGRIYLIINAGTARVTANNAYTVGVWQHVLVTASSNQRANFYINGVLSGTANQDLVQAISTITTTNAPRIGNRATATDRTFDGSIRKVKMWNKVLSAAEIAADYAQGATAVDNLILNVPLGGDYANGTNSGSYVTNMDGNVAALFKASRSGATDKYLATEVNGNLLMATIQET